MLASTRTAKATPSDIRRRYGLGGRLDPLLLATLAATLFLAAWPLWLNAGVPSEPTVRIWIVQPPGAPPATSMNPLELRLVAGTPPLVRGGGRLPTDREHLVLVEVTDSQPIQNRSPLERLLGPLEQRKIDHFVLDGQPTQLVRYRQQILARPPITERWRTARPDLRRVLDAAVIDSGPRRIPNELAEQIHDLLDGVTPATTLAHPSLDRADGYLREDLARLPGTMIVSAETTAAYLARVLRRATAIALALISLALGIATLKEAYRRRRAWRRVDAGRCARCGYPLGNDPICPECGTPFPRNQHTHSLHNH